MSDAVDNITSKKLDFLREKIRRQIEGFDRRRIENRNKATCYSMLSAIGGVTVTVVLGINASEQNQVYSTIALILSGVVTLAGTLESINGYRRLWIQYTATTSELRGLRDDVEYLALNGLDTISNEDVDELYKRLSDVLKSTNSHWVKVREEQVSTTG